MDFGGDQTHDAEYGKTMGQVAQLKRKIDSSEDSVTMLIHLIKKATERIKSVTDRQKNASTFIKDIRLEEMNEAVDKLKEEMELRKEARSKNMGVRWHKYTSKGRTATQTSGLLQAQQKTRRRRQRRKGNGMKQTTTDKAEWSQDLRRGKPRKDRLQSQEVSTLQRKEVKGRGQKHERQGTKEGAKKRQNKPRRRQRLESLLIKPAEGKSYAEVLSDIKVKINPADTGTDIRSIRLTKGGEILLDRGIETKDLQAFLDEVKTTLGKAGVVKNLVPRVALELLDLDSTTTTEDVEEALKRELEGRNGEMKVSISKPNRRGQVIAFVEMSEQVGNKLLENSRIKIGWINSKIRPRIFVPRCFKSSAWDTGTRPEFARDQTEVPSAINVAKEDIRQPPARNHRSAYYALNCTKKETHSATYRGQPRVNLSDRR